MYSNQANMASAVSARYSMRPALGPALRVPVSAPVSDRRQARSAAIRAGIKKYHACANASTKEEKKAMPRPCGKKAKKALAVKRAGGAQAMRQRSKRRRAAAGFGRRA